MRRCSAIVWSGTGAAGWSLSVTVKAAVRVSAPYVQRSVAVTAAKSAYVAVSGVPGSTARNPPPSPGSSSTLSGGGPPRWNSSETRNGTVRPR